MDSHGTKLDDTPPDLPSGRFVLRLDPGLHAALRGAAQRAGLSLNDYCARKLAWPGAPPGPAVEIVRRAVSVVGEALAGVVAFGSWARDELAAESDVDVLVVVEGEVAVTRELYRHWDSEPVCWGERSVDVHFLQMPAPEEPLAGIWAEAAVEGVVLFDRDFGLSRRLVEIRRRIADGVLVRRRAHGQPYWVHAALSPRHAQP